MAGLLVSGLAVVRVYGFTVEPVIFSAVSSTLVLCLLSAFLSRRIGMSRLAGWFEAVALIGLSGAAAMVLLCALTILSGSYVDAYLAQADAALGFYWLGASKWLLAHPTLTAIAMPVYRSFGWQPALIFGLLFWSRRDDRAWQLLTAGLLALVLCVAVFPFAPAEGPFMRSGAKLEDFGPIANIGSLQSGSVIHAVKDEGSRVIGANFKGGLISFPSYHAAAALMFVWATWPLRGWKWLFLALNVGVAASATVVGNHYLVDILLGLAVGAGSVALAHHLNAELYPKSQNRG